MKAPITGFIAHAPLRPDAINSASFNDDIARENHWFIIEFWSARCAACERLMHLLTNAFSPVESVTLYTVNVDEEPELTEDCSVRSLPAVLIYNNQVEVYRSHETRSIQAVADYIKSRLPSTDVGGHL